MFLFVSEALPLLTVRLEGTLPKADRKPQNLIQEKQRGLQDLVTKEVLPSIRKTGSYVTGQPSLVENPKMAVKLASWLDVRSEVWMHLMIDNILRGNIQTYVAVETKEAVAVNEEDSHQFPEATRRAPQRPSTIVL